MVIIYKKVIGAILGIIVLLVGGFIFVVYTDFSQTFESTKDEEITEKEEPVKKEKEAEDETDNGENPFSNSMKQEEMTDEKIMDYLHKMSHQKIHAEAKWGFYEITDERIEWLLKSITKTEEKLIHQDVYERILDRWEDGDFSNSVDDHNMIWKLQGGSIGKALRLLTEEEEATYLEANK